ncbi:MAG: YfiR family protein [Acidobacteria bacterium]|nr:YfiR family protein [Acidobacteriota bacterium]MBI3657017.1 YfiR family protein [Acidobacteriota bacterium]
MAILRGDRIVLPRRRGSQELRRRIIKRFFIGVVSLLLLMSLVGDGAARAAEALGSSPVASEYQVKAAFLYNFAKFIEWPDEAFTGAGAPIVFGIIGEDPFGRLLDQAVKGKSIRGREFVVKRLRGSQDAGICHILFISASEKKHVSQILERLKGAPVVTVSELDHFAQAGGIINFFVEENKVRFEINIDAAERAKLKISSKLLALSKVVRDTPSSGKH